MKRKASYLVFALLFALVLLTAAPHAQAEEFKTQDALVSGLISHIRNLETFFTVDFVSDHPLEPSEWDIIELRVAYSAYGSNISSFGMNPVLVGQQDGTTRYTVEYSASYRVTAEQEAAVNAKIQEIIQSLKLDGKTPYEKAFALYNYVATSCSYDYDVRDISETAYSALIENYSVCEGISSAYARLLAAVGIESYLVTGVMQNIPHGWNAVNIDGTYYYCDITSDLNMLTYTHFMRGWADFPDHSQYDLYPITIIETAGQDVAAELYEWNGLRYSIAKDGIIIQQYEGNAKTLTIPAKINGIPVYRINRYAIQAQPIQNLILEEGIQKIEAGIAERCDALESITLPASVDFTALTGDVFNTFAESVVENCGNLAEIKLAQDNPYLCLVDGVLYNAEKTNIIQVPAKLNKEVVTIPEGVTRISSDAFEYCSNIKKVVIPSTVTYIGYWAFNSCSNLEEINIPDGCKTLGQYFIQGTKVSRLDIPASVDEIMDGAFVGAPLEQITIDPNNPRYKSCDNAIYAEYEDGAKLFYYLSNAQAKTVRIRPGTMTISMNAFENNPYLEEVILNDGLLSIETRAFENCSNLKKITFPEGLLCIQESAFSGTSLSGEVVLPTTLESFGQSWQILPGSVFYGTGVTAITVREPNPCFTSADGCLFNDDLTTLYCIPYAGRTTYTVPDGVKRLASSAIRNVECVTVPESVERFDEGAIICPIILGKRGSAVEAYAKDAGDWWQFHPIPLAERTLTLPQGLTEIQENAFANDTSFEAVILPETCTVIGSGAFRGCTNLLQITIPASVTGIEQDAFDGCPDDLLIFCPMGGSTEEYGRGHNIELIPIN